MTVNGDSIVAAGMKYLGTPYKWGGTDPATGLDCSGFVQRAYNDCGVSLPRVSSAQATMGTAIDSLADAGPGDLVAFGNPVHHIGIYIGGGKMIDAPHTGDVVSIQPAGGPSKIRRVVPPGAGTTPSPNTPAVKVATTAAQASGGDSASGLAVLVDPHTWLRVGVFIGGGVLVLAGLIMLTKGELPSGPERRRDLPGSPSPTEAQATPDRGRETPVEGPPVTP